MTATRTPWIVTVLMALGTVFAMLGVQRSSRTDIGDQRWFDKVAGLRTLAEAARKVLRRHAST